jgi:hypothetical protein
MSANTNIPKVQNSKVTLKYLVNTEHEFNKVFIKMKQNINNKIKIMLE